MTITVTQLLSNIYHDLNNKSGKLQGNWTPTTILVSAFVALYMIFSGVGLALQGFDALYLGREDLLSIQAYLILCGIFILGIMYFSTYLKGWRAYAASFVVCGPLLYVAILLLNGFSFGLFQLLNIYLFK